MILVPVKLLSDAKLRLSAILTPQERIDLARAMCTDVLQALASWTKRPPVAVVTTDSFARDLAAQFNFDVIADDKRVEKKDKTLEEPVQFYVRGARTPYEIVVYSITKDFITGYLTTPKAAAPANPNSPSSH